MKQVLSILTLMIILVVTGCYYDSMESLYPPLDGSCDTVNVTFSKDILPLLSNDCLSCHSNSSAPSSGNNIALENYSDVSARSAAILGSIKHSGGYVPMPKNGGRVSSCFILKFETWIDRGKPQN